VKRILHVCAYLSKINLYFVFCISLELELICEDNDNNGASYEGGTSLGMCLVICCVCVCVVANALVMERSLLWREISSTSFGS
jgi:hypothetical protein